MKRTAQFLAVGIVVSALCLPGIPAQAQTPEKVRLFPETGHTVRGEFLQFFDQRGGEEIFGYPITAELAEDGRTVQYFQRARMELHPDKPAPYRVPLGLLADLLGHRAPPIPDSAIPPANHPQRRYYPATGHTVSFAFLTFFDTHGGLDIFGFPITEFMIEDGLIVQYFQRARMEWHPENPKPNQVQLGKLGETYVERMLPPLASEQAGEFAPQDAPPPAVTALNVSASVRHAVTGQGGYQTVYVYVTDQSGRAVKGTTTGFVVHFQNGDQQFAMPATDAAGYTQLTFSVGNQLPGYIVVIDVTTSFDEVSSATQTSFLPWW